MKPWGPRGGISFRVNLIVMGVVLLLGAALGGFFVAEQRRAIEEETARRIMASGRQLARTIAPELRAGDLASVQEMIQAAALDREVAWCIVKSAGGEPLAGRWASNVRGSAVEYDFPLREKARGPRASVDNELFGVAGAEHGGETIGHLAIGVDLGPQRARIVSLAVRSVLVVVLGAILALVIGNYLVRRLLRGSIQPLLSGIRDIAGDLSRRIAPGRGDEVGEIADAFNDMAAKLSTTLVTKEELESVVVRRTEELERALRERVALEQRLLQSQKLEAIGVLAGGIAHDFNNLLTPIIGYTEVALGRLGDGHPAKRELEIVLESALRASGLTRQILAFSRKQVLEVKVLNLNDEIVSAGKMLARLIGENINIRLDLAADLPNVKADPTQVQQVLMNIAINARDAMPGGGDLTIQTGRAAADLSPPWLRRELSPGQYVIVTISDTGVGMDEATRAQIFEPFFTTKVQGKGTGLGLSTVYGIVKQHGGEITVYSEPGRGTTFRIYLPCAADPEAPPEAPPEMPPRGTGRILLVEDKEAVRDFTGRILSDHGYDVTTAPGAREALEIAGKEAFDLLLSDVVMPGINGPELYARVAAMRPGTRILFISGYPAGSGALKGVFEGGEPMLQKPYSVATLLEKVAAVMNSSAVAPFASSRRADGDRSKPDSL